MHEPQSHDAGLNPQNDKGSPGHSPAQASSTKQEQENAQGSASGLQPTSGALGSLWGRAKGSLSDASTRVSLTSNSLVSKSTKLGASGAEKLTSLGKQTYTVAGDATVRVVQSSKQVYSGSKLESTVNYIDGELDDRSVKQVFKDTTEAVVDKLDQVTGKRLLELLEEKLQVQDLYNNVLATRLAEALERISTLEAQLSKLSGGQPLASDAGDGP